MIKNQKPLNLENAQPNSLLFEEFQIKKKHPHLKYCLIYSVIFISLYLLFVLNYLLSSKSFQFNHYLYIPSDYLCKISIEELTKSLESNTSNSSYIQKNNEVEKCYNKATVFNKKCFMYISEMCLCREKKNKCAWIIRDLRECSLRYNFSNINEIIQYCDYK